MKKYWFRPKRFGYGATPNTKEGWIFIIGFVITILALQYIVPPTSMWYYVLLFGLMLIIIVVSKYKTDGDWKWRWD